MAEELWQAYLEDGEPDVSRGITKEQARSGALHGAVHVWIWRRLAGKLEVLLQRRSHDIATWPDYLDISAAGHIDFGEAPIQAAVRETREELGVSGIQDALFDLAFVYTMKDMPVPNTDFVENELQWVYLLAYDRIHDAIAVDGREVEEVEWVDLEELTRHGNGGKSFGAVVPHGQEYFDLLRSSLQKVM